MVEGSYLSAITTRAVPKSAILIVLSFWINRFRELMSSCQKISGCLRCMQNEILAAPQVTV